MVSRNGGLRRRSRQRGVVMHSCVRPPHSYPQHSANLAQAPTHALAVPCVHTFKQVLQVLDLEQRVTNLLY